MSDDKKTTNYIKSEDEISCGEEGTVNLLGSFPSNVEASLHGVSEAVRRTADMQFKLNNLGLGTSLVGISEAMHHATKMNMNFYRIDFEEKYQAMFQILQRAVQMNLKMETFGLGQSLVGISDALRKASQIHYSFDNFGLQKTMSGISEAVRRASELHLKFNNSGLENVFSGMNEAIKRATEINMKFDQVGLNKSLQLIAENIAVFNRQIGKYDLSAISRAISLSTEQLVRIGNFNLDELQSIAFDLSDEDVEINPDGTVSGRAQAFTVQDIQDIVNSCIEESGILSKLSTIDQAINKLIEITSKLSEPIIKKILIGIIIGVVLAFLNPIIGQISQDLMKVNKKAVVKEFKQKSNELKKIDYAVFNKYRLVTTDCLNVREQNTIKSRVVGKLYFGQVVCIVRKNKNWTLIERYDSETDVYIKGWVFTRYISRLD